MITYTHEPSLNDKFIDFQVSFTHGSVSKTRFHARDPAPYYALKSRNEGLTAEEQYFRVGVQFLLRRIIYGCFEWGGGHIVVSAFDEQSIARKEFTAVAVQTRSANASSVSLLSFSESSPAFASSCPEARGFCPIFFVQFHF